METKLDLYLAAIFIPAILAVFLPIVLLVRALDEIVNLFTPAADTPDSVPNVRDRARSQILRTHRPLKPRI
jgi:hypothetical protein